MLSPPRRSSTLVQIVTCLGFFIVLMDVSVVNVALHSLRMDLHAAVTDLQWVVNAYALVFASLLLMAGALGDRIGAKRVFVIGYGIFTLASIGCGTAPTLDVLIIWRLFQGLGAALLVPTSLSLLRQAFQDDTARSRAIGWWGAGGSIALAAGPVIGGFLIATFGWRSIFLVNVPVGLIGLWMTARYVPSSPTQGKRSLDLPGQVTGALALASLTFALTQASSLGWENPVILGTGLLFLLFGTLFLWLEARNPDAMLPLTLFRDPTVCSATAIGMISNLVFYGMVFTLSLYFQSVQQLTPEKTGFAFLPMMAGLMAMNILSGRLMGRMAARPIVTIGLLVSTAGYLSMVPALAAHSYGLLILPMLFAGSGLALTIPAVTHATLAAIPGAQSGIASGLLNAARQVGGVVGVALFGYLVRSEDPGLFMHGLDQALVVSSALLMIGALIGLRWLGPSVHLSPIAPCKAQDDPV